MEYIREVKKSFVILSVAYLVIGIVLLIWPDISVRSFCYVFGIAMIIFGGAYLIMYFTKDRLASVMQPDLVIGVIALATGFYILLKMEYMLEIIPFALGIVGLLGSIVKVQDALDLKRIGSKRWFLMLIFAAALFALGVLLIMNPFDEQQKLVVILIGVSLLIDGIGNLIGIFWIGILFKKLKRVSTPEQGVDLYREYEGNVVDATVRPVDEEVQKRRLFGKRTTDKKNTSEENRELPAVQTDVVSQEESSDEE